MKKRIAFPQAILRKIQLMLLMTFLFVQAQAQGLSLITWEPVVEMDNMLFPSYIYGSSMVKGDLNNAKNHFGDLNGQIGAVIHRHAGSGNFKLVVEETEFFGESEISGFIGEEFETYEAFPDMRYHYDKLAEVTHPEPLIVTYRFYLDDELVGTGTEKVMVRSVNECPLVVENRKGKLKDQHWLYASYVNENHPRITDEILPKLTKTGITDNLIGYQGTDAQVMKEVFALWKELQDRDIHYSDISRGTITSKVLYQSVRSFESALNSSQANCIDGVVLMASVLYRMGIDPLIVLEPGHAYLGFYVNQPDEEGNRSMYFLETTMLGTKGLQQLDEEYGTALSAVRPETNNMEVQSSFDAFVNAIATATRTFKEHQDKFGVEDNFTVIDISKQRDRGVIALNI